MGITDQVLIELYCPYCGKKLGKSFQTKDLHPSMNEYTIVQALIKNKRIGGGLHLFFDCECGHAGQLDISYYDWKLEKKIEEILNEEKIKFEILENEFNLEKK